MEAKQESNLKNINRLLKLSNQKPIETKFDLTPEHWIQIISSLFLKRTFSNLTRDEEKIKAFEFLLGLLSKKYPHQFTKITCEGLLLTKDDGQLFDFTQKLQNILKDKIIRKLPPYHKKRVEEAIDSLQSLLKGCKIDIEFNSFKDLSPVTWIELVTNLFNLPDKDYLMHEYHTDPIRALTRLLKVLSVSIIRLPIDYIQPIALFQGDPSTCTFMAELISGLGNAIILQTFDNVRNFTLFEPGSSTSILEGHGQSSFISEVDQSTSFSNRQHSQLINQRGLINLSKHQPINPTTDIIPEPLRQNEGDSLAIQAIKEKKRKEYLERLKQNSS